MAGEPEVELADGVLTVTLRDDENRNAIGSVLIAGVRGALARAKSESGIRAVVVTNEGWTFCAGANLKESANASGSAVGGFEDLLREIRTCEVPVIGRIRGHCVGGGVGLAASFDISIATEGVKFGFSEVRLGVTPAIISVVCLPKMRQVDAMEAFIRGNRFSAARAAELGLITRAVPEERLDAEIAEILADIRLGGPNAVGIAKRLVHEVPAMPVDQALAWTAELSGRLFASEEAAEGMAAFVQKRSPSWAVASSDQPG